MRMNLKGYRLEMLLMKQAKLNDRPDIVHRRTPRYISHRRIPQLFNNPPPHIDAVSPNTGM